MDNQMKHLNTNISADFFPILYQNRCDQLSRIIYDDILHEPIIFGKASAMILLSLSIIIGNLLVILAVLISHRLRTVTNLFIASLAVSDFVIGVGVLPFSFTQDLLGFWTFGYGWCRIWLALDVWVSTASIYNLVVIALDRYVAVTRPLSYRSIITTKKAILAICGAWIWSFLVSFPPMVTFQNNAQSVGTFQEEDGWSGLVDCQCTALDNSMYYILFSASSSFYLPFMALLYIYVKIYVKIRRATAAVDKGYVTLKQKKPDQNVVCVQDNNSSKINKNKIIFSTSPLTRMTWRRKLMYKKSPTTEKSESQQPKNLETIALRVHRGRYNAAGATTTEVSKSDRISHNRSRSLMPTARRVGNAKQKLDLSQSSQDIEETDSLSTQEIANTDRGMAVQRPRDFVSCKSVHDRSSGDESIYDRLINDRLACNWSTNDQSIDRRLSNREFDFAMVRSKSTQLKPDNRFLEARRRSSGPAFQNAPADAGSPKNTARLLFREKYDKKLRREVRAAKTVALVTGCFLLCWSGFCVIYTMKALPFCQVEVEAESADANSEISSCIPPWAFTVVLWLGYTNSALNPLIYAVCNRQFRLTFKRILCCRFYGGSHRARTAPDECQSVFLSSSGRNKGKRRGKVQEARNGNPTAKICEGSGGTTNLLYSLSDIDAVYNV